MITISKQEPYIDVLVALSAVSVVFLHTNGIFWRHPTGFLWWNSGFIESLFYFAVPIFFMVSGATLLDYRERYSTKLFLKKRASRTFIPFIFWSFLAALLTFVKHREIDTPLNFVINIINCNYMTIFWFFIPLFACYFSIIVLSKIKDNTKLLWGMVIWAFLSYSIIPFINSVLAIRINPNVLSPISGGYILFILLGFLLANSNFQRKYRYFIYTLGILGFFLHWTGTILITPVEEGSKINRLFKGYLNFPSVFYSVFIFILIKSCDLSNFSKLPIIKIIKNNSLGIYLLHGFILAYIIPKLNIDVSSFSYRLGAPFLIIPICIFISEFLKRFRITSWVI